MAENKKILLYRIDEQAKIVIFVVTEDDERLWGNISEDIQTVLSFDEIFRDITLLFRYTEGDFSFCASGDRQGRSFP